MFLNIREAEFATGINRKTIHKHIRDGVLDSEGRKIEERELYAWAVDRWREGRCLMYPPEQIQRRLEHLYERRR